MCTQTSREDTLNSMCCEAAPGEPGIRRTVYRKVSFHCGRMPFSCGTARIYDFANLGSVKFHVPSPVKTRDEQVAGEMQDRDTSTAAPAAQDKTERASSRYAPAIPHAGVTTSAQLSFGHLPPMPNHCLPGRLSWPVRPSLFRILCTMCSRTLVTRSSQPVSNTMHNAPFPENDDRDAYSIFSARFFHFR